jgi:hypothetical protein
MLLSVLAELHTEVSSTWEAYKQGILDLVAASITTNTVVDPARFFEENCIKQVGKYGSVHSMFNVFITDFLLMPV